MTVATLNENAVEINPYEQQSHYEAIREQEAMRSQGLLMHASTFEMKNLFIERIWYLSESLLLVLTRSLEIKIMYT